MHGSKAEVCEMSKSFTSLIKKAKVDLKLNEKEILELPSVKYILHEKKQYYVGKGILVFSLLFVIFIGMPSSALWCMYKGTAAGQTIARILIAMTDPELQLEELSCLIVPTEFIGDKFRPPVDCRECMNVQGVKRLRNLSPDDFLENYAFSMQPILIEDGQDNWTASQTFEYSFFKEVYSDPQALEKVKQDCQFFPYRTELKSLGEFFNMSEARVAGEEEPWYIGWSNCDGKTANRLREHYKVPYFMPKNLDQSNTDWIFMGLPGYGAHMHIDGVGTLSWQAQIKGIKKWTLQAPPECYGQCIDEMEIIVKPGQIIVLDTNKWFHATKIIGNETSIVIGSEYY